MNTHPDTDPARIYEDLPFPGRRLIAWSVGIWVVGFLLPGTILNPEKLPPWVDLIQSILALPVVILYFIGFWKAVVGKGYPKIFILVSFIPILGLLLIFYLPQRQGSVGDQDNDNTGSKVSKPASPPEEA